MFSHLVLPIAAALLLSTGMAFAEDKSPATPPGAVKEMKPPVTGKEASKHKGQMKEVDTDGDGQVSAAESEAFSRSQFSKIDTNKDGSLSQGELETFHNGRKEDWANSKNKGDKVTEEMKQKMKARMEEEHKMRGAMMDADGDGVVSEDEFMSHSQQRRNRMDVNGDGNVTKEEAMEMREKKRAEHEQRRQELRSKAGEAREGRERRQMPAEAPAE